MKLLVPLDTSEIAEQAVSVAAGIAKARTVSDIRLLLVHQPIRYGGYLDAPWNAARFSMERAYLEERARQLRSLVAATVVADHLTGSPVEAIAEIAASTQVSLIVMTTHGRTGVSRVWLGSVADGVVRSAGVPVLMLRPTTEPSTAEQHDVGVFSRVLIPLDGSSAAESILHPALELAGPNASYILARIVQPVPLLIPGVDPSTLTSMVPDPSATELVLADARQYIEKVADRLAKQGVNATEQCVELGERTASMLLDAAKTRDVDLIALSTHGRGMTRLFVGSVADKLLRGSAMPLLVSRRPAHGEHTTA